MLFKSWGFKLLQTGDPALTQPTYEIEERQTTPESLKVAQTKTEARADSIWAGLSAFEESSALCVRDILAAWRAGDHRSLYMAKGFVLRVQGLFAVIDETRNEPIDSSKAEDAFQLECARALCDETTSLFTLVACPIYSRRDLERLDSIMTRTIVTGLGHRLKSMINITVTGALKLDDGGDTVERFLDGLRALAANDGSAKSMVADKHQLPNVKTLVEKQGSTFGVGDTPKLEDCASLLEVGFGRLSWLLERNSSRTFIPSNSLPTSLTEKVGQDASVDTKELLRYDAESLTPQSPRCRAFKLSSLVGVLLALGLSIFLAAALVLLHRFFV
ncbi:hypothetical protein FRC08_007379 [Ceratobasidium sp. 394]|nr:hypothetical protein FRC08_007379 [Ceratobasidium sp. 394]